MLSTNNTYLWFALALALILLTVYGTYLRKLDQTINGLKKFAKRAEAEEFDDDEKLVFPADELGEISENIVSLYKKLRASEDDKTRLKRQLTQNIAHELKTPISSIQGYMETILSDPNMDNETRMEFVHRSYKQTVRLTNLLRDISLLNKLDENVRVVNFEPINIHNLVDEVFKDTYLELQKAKFKTYNLVAPDLVVNGDQHLLYSIFRNLTDNAIFYAGDGSAITVKSLDVKDDKVHLTFEDNGIGTDPSQLNLLFERFYRVDKGRSRRLGGTGLGLAIVKNAVNIHGGSINASIAETGGLKFSFSLRK